MPNTVKSQIGDIAKKTVRRIAQEPVEVLKEAGKQVGVTPQAHSNEAFVGQQPKPSPEEVKKAEIIQAHRRELEDLISQERKNRQQRLLEERQRQEEKEQKNKLEEQQAKKRENPFFAMLRRVKGRIEFQKRPSSP